MARSCRSDLLAIVDAAIRGASPEIYEMAEIEVDDCLSEDLCLDGKAILQTFELLEEALGITLPHALAVDLALTSPTVGRLVRMLAHELETHHA